MTLLNDEIEEVSVWEGTIAEMGPLDTSTHPNLTIPADFMETITKSDDDPMFVTVEVEAGWSRSKRNWKPEHLRKVVEKVNKERMAGNLGHPLLDKAAYESAFPLPQVAWCSATMEGNKGVFKGYVLKRAEARDLLKLGLIDGVSIFGDTRMKPVQGGYEVITFEPETIDFARKGRSGMKSRVVSLTGEHAPGRGENVEPKDIAAISVDELRTHAPLLVREIERQAVEPVEAKVGEQTALVADLQPQVDLLTEIKNLLKLQDGENPVEKLASFIEQVEEAGKSEIKDFVNSLVSKKIKSTRGQALLRRLVGEMETEFDGELTDDLKREITTAFEAKIDGDDDIKALVGEMADFEDDPNEEEQQRGRGGSNLGGRSRAGFTRGRSDRGDGVVKRNENLVVKTVKF
jgi:hypothetical protein